MTGMIGADDIRELRTSLGLSRAEFARSIGVAPRTVEFWEQSRGIPSRTSESVIMEMAQTTEKLRTVQN